MTDTQTTTSTPTFPLPAYAIDRLLTIANQESNHSASIKALQVLIENEVDLDAYLKLKAAKVTAPAVKPVSQVDIAMLQRIAAGGSGGSGGSSD